MEDPVQALPLPQAPLGLAQVHGAFLISLHSGASRHGSAMSPGDTPYLAASPFFRSTLSLVSLSILLSPSYSFSLLPLFLAPPFPGASLPSRAGQQTRHRVATAI